MNSSSELNTSDTSFLNTLDEILNETQRNQEALNGSSDKEINEV